MNIVKNVFVIYMSLCFWIDINAQNCNYEKISVLIDNYQLKLTQKSLGVDLKYSFFRKKYNLFIDYHYSGEVVFLDTIIAELTDTGIKMYNNLYLHNDILILPLIGTGDSRLLIFVINLKQKKILTDNIRTSLDFVWVKNENGLYLITSNTPILNDNNKYDCIIYLWKIEENNIFKIKEENIELEEDFRWTFDIDTEYCLIQRQCTILHLFQIEKK
jgi:hypothetical protein